MSKISPGFDNKKPGNILIEYKEYLNTEDIHLNGSEQNIAIYLCRDSNRNYKPIKNINNILKEYTTSQTVSVLPILILNQIRNFNPKLM